ncbi:DUF4157 domain-containing protein [Streptomyces sp. DG2A-72]|uniref:eCIS core domain-containing protein n=1 Tax=Streptomyces sp. DG2A-72 TaxID=3051386 RepID=UPI00265C70D9|nr:DUF4157 domain-containing protein [Streptomyces sp. DG2A-72]MDO0932834.1 DUF4157 domain-containing protein [Streptomyces sp. DG2A-72]
MQAHDHDVTRGAERARTAAPPAKSPLPQSQNSPAVGGMPPAPLLALQRTVGNAAVSRMVEQERHEHGPDCGHEQAEPVQRRHRPAEPVQGRSAVHDVLGVGGRPFGGPLKQEMEARLGADFSDVRLHTDAAAKASAAEIGARAYTSGNHVVLGAGGADKHTLAHELTHVIQQRSGPVAGSDNGAGLKVSDPHDRFERAAEANAHAVLNRPMPTASSDAGAHEGDRSVQRAEKAGTVQRTPDGTTPPTSQNPGNPAPPAISQEQFLAVMAGVKDHIANRYIEDHVPDLRDWATGANDAEAYRTMTDKGSFWTRSRNHEPTTTGGRAFVASRSQTNTDDMAIERGPNSADWQTEVEQKLVAALNERVLHHYTSEGRINTIFENGEPGEMKSKQKLVKDDPSKANAHNTGEFDEQELANDGFVFFFIGKKNAAFRNTRFSEGSGRPARIEVPIDGLVKSGWIMMNDFLDQEYPTLRSDAEGNLLSYKRDDLHPQDPKFNSPEGKMMEAMASIRGIWTQVPHLDVLAKNIATFLSQSFANGAGSVGPQQTQAIMDLAKVRKWVDDAFKNRGLDGEYRGLVNELESQFAKSVKFDTQVRRFDPDSELIGGQMRYMEGTPGAKSPEAKLTPGAVARYKEHLRGNILAGPHIIPGLASRGVLEITRIEGQGGHDALVRKMKAMLGDDLVDMLLKDFIRPQAMMPWSVAITRGDVTYKS